MFQHYNNSVCIAYIPYTYLKATNPLNASFCIYSKLFPLKDRSKSCCIPSNVFFPKLFNWLYDKSNLNVVGKLPKADFDNEVRLLYWKIIKNITDYFSNICYIIQDGSVCAPFTGAAYRVKYFKPITKEINQDTSTV